MIRRTLTCLAALALSACAVPPPPTMPSAPPPPAPTPLPVPPEAPHIRDFSLARADFIRSTAKRYGVAEATIEATLAKATIRDSIINAMSRPAEAKPWADYRPIFIQPKRIDGGRAFLASHRDALKRAEAKYGVPAEIITAIIGVETSYGGNKGSYPVVDALYTLAFAYPRSNDPSKLARENQREAFFRDELAQLFALGKGEGFDISTLKGSYAGAMGWGQFMPSSYREFAVDGNGDGKRDLFNNLDDVFSSVANYFIGRGAWQPGGPVMQRAVRDAGAAAFNADKLDLSQNWASLAKLGYRPANLALFPAASAAPANLITLDGANGPEYWIVYNNFKAITKYNTSRLYATAVYQLAQAIAGRDPDPK